MIHRIAFLTAMLITLSASAQAVLTDSCSRHVTVNADGSFTAFDSDGTTLNVTPKAPGDQAAALRILDGMASASCMPKPPSKPTQIARAEFLDRFTRASDPGLLKRIIVAAQTNSDLGLWLQLVQAQDRIDLTSPLIKQGLDAFVAAAVMTAAQEAAILTP